MTTISSLRRAADPRAADAAVGRGRHLGRGHRDARRPLRRGRGLGLLVDPADRRRGRARAARARHRGGRRRTRRRPGRDVASRCGSTCTRRGAAGSRRSRSRASISRCGMPRPAPRQLALGASSAGARESVRAYGSGVNLHYTLDELVAQVRALGGRRASTRSRSRSASPTSPRTSTASRAVREVLGPDRALMIDANQRWDLETGDARRSRCSPRCRPAWIEEPLRADDLSGHVELAGA